MHFKLDLKEKMLMKKKKSGENGTFLKIRPLPCPFFVCLENGTLLSAAFTDRWRDGWKSASERLIWSAFNGLEGKAREGGTVPFFLLLGRVLFLELSFWNNPRSRFFWFPVTVFIVHELFLWDSQAAPATIVLSQLDLFGISQTKWKILTIMCKQWISERLRVGFRGETAVQGRAYIRVLFVFLALFWPCFSPRTLYFVALRTLLRMSLMFQRSLPTPLSSQKCPPTPQINTQFEFFHSSPHLNQSPGPPRYCRSLRLFLTTSDGQLFGPVELAC